MSMIFKGKQTFLQAPPPPSEDSTTTEFSSVHSESTIHIFYQISGEDKSAPHLHRRSHYIHDDYNYNDDDDDDHHHLLSPFLRSDDPSLPPTAA